MLKCYICHDKSVNFFYQICICKESLLCNDCFEEINRDNNKIKNECAICKRKLKLIKHKKYNFYKYLIRYIAYILLILIINNTPPTIIFLNNIDVINYNEKPNMSLGINIIIYLTTIIFLTSLKEVTINSFIKYLRITQNVTIDLFYLKYNIFNSILNSMFIFILLFSKIENIFLWYYSFVLLFVYFIPLIIIGSLQAIEIIIKELKKINFEYTDKKLKILGKIENDNIFESIQLFEYI